jgi:DNA adenine methylase
MAAKPILKWVGGKTQIIKEVFSKFPKEIKNYHEPFLGGGSVLFTLLHFIEQNYVVVDNIYASDSNEALIYIYKNIQDNYMELYNDLMIFVNEFNEITELKGGSRNPETHQEALFSKESYYYYIRKTYNKLNDTKSIRCSALFIFLNKTCFRGLYRIGPNGFNVPYGNNKNPEIINLQHLRQINQLIQGVTFTCCDFTDSLKKVKDGDFIYADPPYVPINKTSFVGYNIDGFNKHQILFDYLRNCNAKFLMSNSEVDSIKQQFDNYIVIKARRAINSKNPENVINELLIFN